MTDATTEPAPTDAAVLAADAAVPAVGDGARSGRRRRLRRMLSPLVASVLTAAVVAPLTWHLAARGAPTDEPLPTPSGPVSREELHDLLVAQLPDRDVPGAVLVAASPHHASTVGLPPERYRVDLVCGQLRRQGSRPDDVHLNLRTPRDFVTATMPCPSTVLSLPDPLDFRGVAAGALMLDVFSTANTTSYLVLLHFVPIEATATGGNGA